MRAMTDELSTLAAIMQAMSTHSQGTHVGNPLMQPAKNGAWSHIDHGTNYK